MNKEKINAEAAKIREILDANPGGHPNAHALNQIKRCSDKIISLAQDDGYIREKAGDLKGESDVYYSARKHLKFKSDFTDGHQVIRGRIHSLLSRIESWHGWKDVPNLTDESP
jgi:hypothetical protein